jgi:hypothetical protein
VDNGGSCCRSGLHGCGEGLSRLASALALIQMCARKLTWANPAQRIPARVQWLLQTLSGEFANRFLATLPGTGRNSLA